MRLGWAVLACMVVASGAHSAPNAAYDPCHPPPGRVQGVFIPKTASPQVKAKLLAKFRCLKAKRYPILNAPNPASKPK
jgi:hypothetical protein